jgi:hypothetical protein
MIQVPARVMLEFFMSRTVPSSIYKQAGVFIS